MAATKDLALDIITFIWTIVIMGAEVPQPAKINPPPQQKPKQKQIRRVVTWQDSVNELQGAQ